MSQIGRLLPVRNPECSVRSWLYFSRSLFISSPGNSRPERDIRP